MKFFTAALLLFAFHQDKAKSGIAVIDTGSSMTEPLPLGETPTSFKGDAVVTNGRISLVVAKNGSAAELRTGTVCRARLHLLGAGSDPVARLDRVGLLEYGKGGATLEISGKTPKGVSVTAKLRIKKGDITVEAQ